jgi:hypothetical protein
MFPSWAFLPVSRFVLAFSTVTGTCISAHAVWQLAVCWMVSRASLQSMFFVVMTIETKRKAQNQQEDTASKNDLGADGLCVLRTKATCQQQLSPNSFWCRLDTLGKHSDLSEATASNK